MAKPGEATRLFVSQLTREHLRKTLSFFLSIAPDQKPVPFQEVGTGTLNTLVLALLSFIAELKEENVIFAMEEPEIALPPHTQRRIADYLLTKTTQCLVTSHSPYVIESFEPERTLILRRDDKGTVSGKQITLSADIKAKTYRRHLRRSISEAMLARGVIVTEGFTEVVTLQAVAAAMEGADAKNYPLDLAGVSIITPDGDGSVPEFGRFFASLDLPVFAFLDKKTRPPKDVAALAAAGFTILNETAYSSMEALLVAEVPLNRQWQYLEQIRDSGSAPGVAIPATRPADDQVRAKAKEVLAGGKGWGRSAELIELCAAAELPVSVTGFLTQVYLQFPRPVVKPIEAVKEESTGDVPPKPEGGVADDASPPTEGGGA
jgi:putative ATP-dependent endonuclease of OLD family